MENIANMPAPKVEIRLENAFGALADVSVADCIILGRDPYRKEKDIPRLQEIDAELAEETIKPLTKPVGNPDSVWFNLHFKIIMKALETTWEKISADEAAQEYILTPEDTRKRTPYFEDVRLHVADFRSLQQVMADITEHLPAQADKLLAGINTSLECLPEDDRTRTALEGFAERLRLSPKQQQELYIALKEHKAGTPPDFRAIVEIFLAAMPQSPEDLPAGLKQRLDTQKDQKENRTNDFWGRLVQTYYAEREKDYIKYGYDDWMPDYMESPPQDRACERSIYERTKNYFLAPDCLPSFPQNLKDDNGLVPDHFSIAQIAVFFSSFLRNPEVVEMVHPSFGGAATKAARSIMVINDWLAKRTHDESDYHSAELAQQDAETLLSDTDLLRRMGRMAMVMDAIGNGKNFHMYGGMMNAKRLCGVACDIWPDNVRQEVWGAGDHYIPPAKPARFDEFRQDIATVCYALALNIEDHRKILDNNPGKLAEQLKLFAEKLFAADDIQSIRRMVSLNKELFGDVKITIKKIAEVDSSSTKAKEISLPLLQNSLGVNFDVAIPPPGRY